MWRFFWSLMTSVSSPLLLTAFAGITACMGCTANLPNKFEHPPLLQRIDARVGMSFRATASDYVYVMDKPKFRFPIGQASVGRFRQVFQAMFAKTIELPESWRNAVADVDGVVELDGIMLQITRGVEGAWNDIVTVYYRVCLYQPDGFQITCTSALGADTHIRHELDFSCFPLYVDRCLAPQTDAAMRHAIARFISDFEADPQVKAWAIRVADGKRAN